MKENRLFSEIMAEAAQVVIALLVVLASLRGCDASISSYIRSTGPEAYWKFDEPDCANGVHDSSGNGHHGSCPVTDFLFFGQPSLLPTRYGKSLCVGKDERVHRSGSRVVITLPYSRAKPVAYPIIYVQIVIMTLVSVMYIYNADTRVSYNDTHVRTDPRLREIPV